MEHLRRLQNGDIFIGHFVTPSRVHFVEYSYKYIHGTDILLARYFILGHPFSHQEQKLIYFTYASSVNLAVNRIYFQRQELDLLSVFLRRSNLEAARAITDACEGKSDFTISDHADLTSDDLKFIEEEKKRLRLV